MTILQGFAISSYQALLTGLSIFLVLGKNLKNWAGGGGGRGGGGRAEDTGLALGGRVGGGLDCCCCWSCCDLLRESWSEP